MSKRMANERLEAIRRTIEAGSTEVGWQYAMPEMLVEIDRLRQREQEADAHETVLRETLKLLVRFVQYERHAADDQQATACDNVSFAIRKANAALSISPSNAVRQTQAVLETARHVATHYYHGQDGAVIEWNDLSTLREAVRDFDQSLID